MANKTMLRAWLLTNRNIKLEKGVLFELATKTNLSEYQVYDFLNNEKKKLKKIERS